MRLLPWGPFTEVDVLRREMDRLWERFFAGWPAEWRREEWAPSLDVSETKDKVVVKAEVPGIDPKDIDVSFSNGVLTIRGEKKQEREEKDANYHLVERSYGSFSRSVNIPVEVEENKVKANYKDGVLKISFPKTSLAKEKEIKIEIK